MTSSDFIFSQSASVTENGIESIDNPIIEIQKFEKGYYKLIDANIESINAEASELYPYRLVKQYNRSKGFGTHNVEGINFNKFVKYLREEFGPGEYELCLAFHQPFIMDNDDGTKNFDVDGFMLRNTAVCPITIHESGYDIGEISETECFVYYPDINVPFSLSQWKLLNENLRDEGEIDSQFVDGLVSDMVEQLPKNLDKMLLNESPLKMSEIWDKITVHRQRFYS